MYINITEIGAYHDLGQDDNAEISHINNKE